MTNQPFLFSKTKVQQILTALKAESLVYQIIIALLYGTGMRLMEGLRLRVKDVDFDYLSITVRDDKGNKDRITIPTTFAPCRSF